MGAISLSLFRKVTTSSLATLALAILPTHSPAVSAAAAREAGCCEAIPMWFGAMESLVAVNKEKLIKSDVPPGWYGDFATPQYFLPRGADIRLSAVLGGDSVTAPSRGRYSWELDCFSPSYRTRTDPQFIDLPAGPTRDPASPPIPMATVSGTLNLGACENGYMWFHYDQGDPSFGEALLFQFDAFNPPPTGNVALWAWVTPEQANQIQLTGKLPIPTTVRMGMYFLKAQEYATAVSYLYTGYKLVRGTITLSDALFEFAENFNQVEGYFLPTNLIGEVNFQVVN